MKRDWTAKRPQSSSRKAEPPGGVQDGFRAAKGRSPTERERGSQHSSSLDSLRSSPRLPKRGELATLRSAMAKTSATKQNGGENLGFDATL